MAAFTMNDTLKALMEEVLLLTTLFEDESEPQTLRFDLAAEHVSLKSVVILMKALKVMKKEGTLHSYTAGSKIIMPFIKPPTPQVTDDLIQRRHYLKLRKEAKEYNMMIYGTEDNPNEQDILTTGNQFASLTNQLTISVNMIVAIFAMFGIGYYVGMQYSDNKSTQMTFGLVSAIGIMVVEMILFIRRATQMEAVYEKAPTALEEANAQIRSGALLTSNRPSVIPTAQKSDMEAKMVSTESNVDIPLVATESKKTR